MKLCAGLVLLAIVVAGILLTLLPRSTPQHERTATTESVPRAVLRNVTLVEVGPDGETIGVQVGEVRRVGGRIGFLRSPLLSRIELRDVRVLRDGRVVHQVDVVSLDGVTVARGLAEGPEDESLRAPIRSLAASFAALAPPLR